MKLIQDNPYRIAGILSSANESEFSRQKTRILNLAQLGRQFESDFDFSFLNKVDRTDVEKLKKTFDSIQQREEKVRHSIFWFIKVHPFDEIAIDYLKKGDKEKAIDIWEKKTNEKEVNSKNFSHFNNIGTIKLLSDSVEVIKEGIEAKIKLIESPYFTDFVHAVADLTYTLDIQKETKKFVDDILKQFKGKYSNIEILKLFENSNEITKKYLSRKFTEEPIGKVETQIENCKKKRKDEKYNSYKNGLKLYIDTLDDLLLLETLLGTNDLQYKSLADQLAKEIMQCGIDYFNEWKESKNPSEESLKLLKYAQTIAQSAQSKERIKENIEGIKEWAETAPIKEDINYITNKLKNFQNTIDSIENAKSLVSSCKSKLQNIKNILGSTDELYLNVSSAVVNNALGMIIEVVNKAQSGLGNNRTKLLSLSSTVSEAVLTIYMIDSLDMNTQTRKRFSENMVAINRINSQLNSVGGKTIGRTGYDDDEGEIPWLKIIGWGVFILLLIRACA